MELELESPELEFKLIVSSGIGIGIKNNGIGIELKQGISEGFESCDRPIVRKHPIWVKIDDVLSRVTLKFDG